jgi:hypothetical protein
MDEEEVEEESEEGDDSDLDELLETIKEAVYDLIDNEVWEWGNITKRRNGSVVASPRNIVDTGKLRNDLTSFSLSRKDGTITIVMEDYAAYVHADRPYVTDALDKLGLNSQII